MLRYHSCVRISYVESIPILTYVFRALFLFVCLCVCFIFFLVWSVIGPFARISQRYFTGIELTLGISVHSWLEHMRTHKTSTPKQSTNKRSHIISNILTFSMCNQRPMPWNNLIITILVARCEYIKVTCDYPNNQSLWVNDWLRVTFACDFDWLNINMGSPIKMRPSCACSFSTRLRWTRARFGSIFRRELKRQIHFEGILPKGPYLPCISVTGRAHLAGYPRVLRSYNDSDSPVHSPHETLGCNKGQRVCMECF